MKGAAPDSPLVAALAYRKRGWSVIAMQARGKRPIVPWLRYESEFASVATVRGWFSRWPQANVGIVTGALSGLIVLDVDPRHGGDESLKQIESTAGALPVTVEARSGGGGRHVYFAHPGVRVPNRIGLRSGLDVRGDGGCIVAPPSVHASGVAYRWVNGRSPDEVALAQAPAWLIAAHRPLSRKSPPKTAT